MSKTLATRIYLALGAVALALTAACGGDAQSTEAAVAVEDTRRVINVEVTVLQAQDFGDVIRLTGTVAADREVTVAAEEAGTVAQVLVDKGTPVNEGQPLIRLDDDLLQAQWDEARAQSKLAHELWKRVRRLYEEDGIGTESGYLESRYSAEGAAARLALIHERLQRTTIRAPFGGIFDTRLVEVGSVVAPGQPVGSVVDLTPLKVTAGVPERYAADVALGVAAGVSFSDLGHEGVASVAYVGAQVHPDNRTFLVELSLDSPVVGAKPQMVADVVLQRRVLPGVVVVPRQALIRTEAGYAAFVVVGTGDEATASARQVTQGPSASDRVVITEGLSPGDRVVIVGQNQVADGDRVRIVGE
jgi:RND family efflux transporter MFP subunit